MRVVADSHAIVWYVQGSLRLSEPAAIALAESEAVGDLVVSVATLIDLWYVTEKRAQAHGFSRGSSEPDRAVHMGDTPAWHHAHVEYRTSNKTVFSAMCHLVWCPKYRRRVLVGKVESRIAGLIRELCAEHQVDVLGLEIMADHVHLFAEIPPGLGLSRFMQVLKGRSSRLRHQEFPHLQRMRALWNPSWFVSTVGGAPLSVIEAYVENQKIA